MPVILEALLSDVVFPTDIPHRLNQQDLSVVLTIAAVGCIMPREGQNLIAKSFKRHDFANLDTESAKDNASSNGVLITLFGTSLQLVPQCSLMSRIVHRKLLRRLIIKQH
ncbi:hypothetical protein AC1031_013412 [Aphanomyces cochlioides]|nr:hypothetical protein AC1031_013412 [Aphanomyces cochlioides]